MTADFRAELQRLLGAVENDVIDTNDGLRFQAAVNRARAALAQPEPEGLTDKELLGCMLKAAASVPGGQCTGILDWDKEAIAAARAVIAADRARFGRPAIEPVPVSERLPGPEDCDAMGRCWWFTHKNGNPAPFRSADWSLYAGWRQKFTHWLPHNALPVPGAEGCETGTHPV